MPRSRSRSPRAANPSPDHGRRTKRRSRSKSTDGYYMTTGRKHVPQDRARKRSSQGEKGRNRSVSSDYSKHTHAKERKSSRIVRSPTTTEKNILKSLNHREKSHSPPQLQSHRYVIALLFLDKISKSVIQTTAAIHITNFQSISFQDISAITPAINISVPEIINPFKTIIFSITPN